MHDIQRISELQSITRALIVLIEDRFSGDGDEHEALAYLTLQASEHVERLAKPSRRPAAAPRRWRRDSGTPPGDRPRTRPVRQAAYRQTVRDPNRPL